MKKNEKSGSQDSDDAGFMSPLRKASKLNSEGAIFGSFAEIGAGQEVVRTFFEARQASQTVAKTISAYAMAVSDAVYLTRLGITDPQFVRYTARFRLLAMLAHEQNLMLERFCTKEQIKNFSDEVNKKGRRPHYPRLFAYANTMASGEYRGGHEIFHGWMGVRMQGYKVPLKVNEAKDKGSAFVDFIIHVILLETERSGQRDTIGRMGVNLIYAARSSFSSENDLNVIGADFADSLFEGIEKWKARVDVIEINPSDKYRHDFKDQRQFTRYLSFMAVETRLSHDVLFSPHRLSIPSELYSKRTAKGPDAEYYEPWRKSLDSNIGAVVDEWTYPQEGVAQLFRFEACEKLYLLPGKITDSGNSSTIETSPDAIKYLDSLPASDSEIKIVYIPLAGIELDSDQKTRDFKKFNRAYENWLLARKASAVLITRSNDLGWITESIQRSYRKKFKITILFDLAQWIDFVSQSYGHDKDEVYLQAEHEQRGLKGELQREAGCLSNNILDCLQRIERAGCRIRVLGLRQDHGELPHYIEHLIKQKQLRFATK